MREQLHQFRAGVEKLKTSPQAEKLHKIDGRIGRMIGAAKAAGWIIGAAFLAAAGWAIVNISDGWTEYAATLVAAACVLYAVWRAYRGLFHAPRASEVVMDEIMDRVGPAEQALSAAGYLHGKFAAKKGE